MKSILLFIMRTAATLVVAAALAAAAGAAPLSEADQQCLGCHGQQGLTKSFGKDEGVPLHLSGDAFAASVHAPVGCAACHSDIDIKKHPATPSKFESKRAFSIAATEACKACHGPIAESQADSVHGKARDRETKLGVPAPICSDCHRPHQVKPTDSAEPPNTWCAGCHADVVARHDKWLTNAKRHLESVACAACHSPASKKQIDLRLYDAAGKREIEGAKGAAELAAKSSSAGPLSEQQLGEIVRTASASGKVTMVGRMEVASGEAAHALGEGKQAVKDCTTCHRKGAAPFQNVSLSMIGPDGRRVRYPAQNNVLHAPTSVDSVGGFYAMGGTRITALDVLLALALAGGILAPLGHLALRKLMRKKDKGNA